MGQMPHRPWSRVPAGLGGCLLGLAMAVPADAATLTYGDEVRNPDLQRFTRWVDALNQHVADMIAAPERCAAGEQSYCSVLNYHDYLASLVGADPRAQIEAVNSFVNQVEYIEDEPNYGLPDYWAAPLEFFRNGGDCEDFAIAKYVALRQLGYSDEDVRVWVVHDEQRAIDHAVLTVATGGRTFILDSLTDAVMDADTVGRYTPIYSINASGWWLHDMDQAREAVRTGGN